MRVHLHHQSADDAAAFTSALLMLGEGKLPQDSQGLITVSHLGHIVDDERQLIDSIFPQISTTFGDVTDTWLQQRSILAPTNAIVNHINHIILNSLPGNAKTFTSFDSVVHDDDSPLYPTELLHSKEPPGVPSHIITLKKGVPIILMRNLDPPRLCNGTRLRVTNIGTNIIQATILTGSHRGELAYIPRIPIISSALGFEFKRVQFPIKLAFAMTINKSQGQTLHLAGLHLLDSCFSHGQLYVACSRVSSKDNLYILAPQGKTVNIVHQPAIS